VVRETPGVAAADAGEREYGKLYPVARATVLPLFKLVWRIKVQGLEHVPPRGGAIMCPNHTSVIDSFFLPAALPRRITFVGKAEYMDSWKTKHLFPALGMIPIDRGGGSATERALDTAAGVIARGELFGIYPEGTRARDGKLHKGHTGPARLAVRTGAPIVPVGILGTREIQPPDAKFPKMFKEAEIRFGRPIRVEKYEGREDDHLIYRQIIDEVMYEIRELTGQEYVDTYATKKADALPTEVAQVPTLNGHGDGKEPIDITNGAVPRSSAEVLSRR
jgi:1-acyl-sn-glycerol-3-phosphate acyltransferase